MKKFGITMMVVLMALFSKGQNKPGFFTMINTLTKGSVDTVSSESLKQLINEGEIVLLDAREKSEYDVSHLPNALWVGYDTFKIKSVQNLDREKPVVVYCSIGKRSEDIGMKLKEAGFTKVYNHYGGIFDWTNKGFKVVNNSNESVTCVHPYDTFWGIWVNNYERCYDPR
jgi:rhodanese-related sulfurtransferase